MSREGQFSLTTRNTVLHRRGVGSFHRIRTSTMNPATESDRARAIDRYLRALHGLGVISDERTARPFLADFFRNVDFTGRRVLDIGGGEGIYRFYAAGMGARGVVCLQPDAAGSSSG